MPFQHQHQVTDVLEETSIALDHLQLVFEEMQTSLEAFAAIEAELLQQQQQRTEKSQHYYSLFNCSPNAYLIMTTNGLILQANQAAARLFNLAQDDLVRMPFAHFVTGAGWQIFRTRLNRLLSDRKKAFTQNQSIQPFGSARYWKITFQTIEPATAATPLPRSLDGLQVLIVDDEIDAREFITAVLEVQGIRVTAVATAAATLEVLERSHPDVLVCDIRIPDEDGYSLIRKVRQLEATQGRHIPAVAFTVYLEESQEKALTAGFEAHLHKLAQPTELIDVVVRLSGRAPVSS